MACTRTWDFAAAPSPPVMPVVRTPLRGVRMPRGKIRLLASASLRRTCGLRRMSTEPKQAWSPQPPLIRGALASRSYILMTSSLVSLGGFGENRERRITMKRVLLAGLCLMLAAACGCQSNEAPESSSLSRDDLVEAAEATYVARLRAVFFFNDYETLHMYN